MMTVERLNELQQSAKDCYSAACPKEFAEAVREIEQCWVLIDSMRDTIEDLSLAIDERDAHNKKPWTVQLLLKDVPYAFDREELTVVDVGYSDKILVCERKEQQ